MVDSEARGNPSSSTGMAMLDAVVTNAVSYTHLRAHETVLDLVCRLLLEKKKAKEVLDLYAFHQIIPLQVTRIPERHTTRNVIH